MSTKGWEDCDEFVGYGILRDSEEGRRLIEEEERNKILRKQRDAENKRAEEELNANPIKRLSLLTADIKKCEHKRKRLEAEMAAIDKNLARLHALVQATREEAIVAVNNAAPMDST